MGNILKRAAALAAGMAVVASTTISTDLPASAATECSTAFSKYAQISQGSTGDQAEAAECLLAEAGFTTTVDGSFSADDAAALAKFRGSIGLKALKTTDRPAWSALLSQGTTPKLRKGDQGESVVRLQQSLRAAGFSKVTDTATFDAETVKAVKETQKLRHLKASGLVGPTVWIALQNGKIDAANIKAPVKKPVVKKPVAKKAKKKHKATKGEKALAFARRQLGERYRYGAAGPNSWDCSGLTMKAWRAAGVRLPHSARAQFHRGHKVSRSHLKKGDLVFFYSGISHVGIYAGNGKIIHASRPGRPVSYIKIKYMPYQGARRP